MKKLLIVLYLTFVGVANAQIPDNPKDVPQYLQDISVTVKAGSSQGSAVIVVKPHFTYAITAGHVVSGLRSTRKVIRDGMEKTVVEFKDPKIVKVFIEKGRTVGRMEIECEIVKYSDPDHGDDVAVLRLRKSDIFTMSTRFYQGNDLTLGTDLLHVGSFLGESGSNSFSKGSLAQIGRVIEGKPYLQCNLGAWPGSSGGGVFLSNGTYVGMLQRGVGETYNFVAGYDRLTEWANTHQMDWLMNEKGDPTLVELKKIPIED